MKSGTWRTFGVLANRIGGILVCGENGIMQKAQVFRARRFGAPEIQETSLNHVDLEPALQEDHSVTVTQTVFTDALQLLSTSADLWRQRPRLSDPSETWECHCKYGVSRSRQKSRIFEHMICTVYRTFFARPNTSGEK